MILSNIAVHREQAPAGSAYFDPADAESLSQLLISTLAQSEGGPAFEMEQAARSTNPVRTLEFAKTFVAIAREAVQALSAA